MPNPVKQYPFPDETLITALQARGITTRCLWQLHGPKGSQIAWLECWMIQQPTCFPTMVIIQTFKDGNGWDAFTPPPGISTDDTIEDVIARTRRVPPDSAR